MLRDHQTTERAKGLVLGAPINDDDYVFRRVDGRPHQPDNVSHAFVRIARKAGLKGVNFHSFRHTHASLMLAAATRHAGGNAARHPLQ